MADKDLQTINSSGDITEMKIGGTGTGNLAQTLDDLTGAISDYDDSRLAVQIFGFSTAASQDPGATDTPIKIEFGAAQGTGGDPVMVDVNGKLTFNDAGRYIILLSLNYGRIGATGTSLLFMRQLDDGAQVTTTLAIKLTSSDVIHPFFISQYVSAEAGRTVEFEFYRDSTGHDSGALIQETPTIGTWSVSPSAAVAIFKA